MRSSSAQPCGLDQRTQRRTGQFLLDTDRLLPILVHSNHARGGKGQILLGELVVEHGQILHLFRGAFEPGLADPPTR